MAIANDRLISAVSAGNLEIVKEILDTSDLAPWSPEGISEYHAKTAGFTYGQDETVLHLASMYNRGKVIEVLLKHGADIDSRTTCGETALHMSSQRACEDAVKTLLEYGADINITCNAGRTPLYYWPYCTHRKSLSQLFKLHVIKMQAANRYVSEENLRIIVNSDDTSILRNDCEREIDSMRREKICSNVSFYNILTEDKNKLAKYARMESVQALKSACYRQKFPIYSGWIDTNLRRGQQRKDLMDQATNSFNSLIDYKLLDVLTIEICRYASNDDLKNLMTVSDAKNLVRRSSKKGDS